MTGCGTAIFTRPDDYRANVPGLHIALALTGRDAFRARVTWVKLQRLTLVRLEEDAPRIAFVSFARELIFVSFPLRGDPVALWNGVPVGRGDVVLHEPGGHIHQLTERSSRWGVMALTADDLATYGRILLGSSLAPPPAARVLRPRTRIATDILRLHAQACRLARNKPDAIAHPEVVRALEQDLMVALIRGLAVPDFRRHAEVRQRHAEIMGRFENVLAALAHRHLAMPELCAAVGAPERRLRLCCRDFLRRNPLEYAFLRRPDLARPAESA
jgi:hypothetical protein